MQRRQGRPNLLADVFLVKVKDVVTRVRMAAGVISRKIVIAVRTGVTKANFSPKTSDRLWRSHCTDQRLGKGCIEINGVV